MEPMLPCFDSLKDWILFCGAAKESLPHGGRLTRTKAAQMACRDCNLYDQFIATARGRCHPPEGAITPIQRKQAGAAEDDDADE
jgi:hypothetical protein